MVSMMGLREKSYPVGGGRAYLGTKKRGARMEKIKVSFTELRAISTIRCAARSCKYHLQDEWACNLKRVSICHEGKCEYFRMIGEK